jgi:hypothetical protein
MRRPEHGNNFLTGKIEGVWDIEKGHTDFASLSTKPTESDFLTRKLIKLVPMLHQKLKAHRDVQDKILTYDDVKIKRVADGFSTVFSAILPTLSILILYNIHQTSIRLGLIIVFTTLFAATLVTVSSARRVEVFAATTA